MKKRVANRSIKRALRVDSWSLTLATVTFAIYAPTVGFEYVQYDDPHYVYGIPELSQGINSGTVHWALTNTVGWYWHPVASLFHLLSANLVGLDAGAQHLVSAALHTVTAGALYLVLRSLTGAPALSFSGAALWAWHPMRVEDVAWVTARPDIMMALFCVLAVGAYARYARRPSLWRYAIVALCYVMATLTKPAVPGLPLGLLFLDIWPLGRFEHAWRDARWRGVGRLFVEKVPLLALGAAVTLAAMWPTFHATAASIPSPTNANRALAVAAGCGWYALKTFVPIQLAVLYPWSNAWSTWPSVLALMLLLAVTAGVLRSRSLPLIAAWGWAGAMLLPVLGAAGQRAAWVADRYASIPHLFFFAGLVAAVSIKHNTGHLTNEAPTRVRRMAFAAAVALALLSALQVRHWKDSESLFTHTLRLTRDNAIIHYNFGVALQEQGRMREAAEHYAEALRLQPGYRDAHVNLGAALEVLGDLAGAERHYRAALSIDPEDADARANLKTLLSRHGRPVPTTQPGAPAQSIDSR